MKDALVEGNTNRIKIDDSESFARLQTWTLNKEQTTETETSREAVKPLIFSTPLDLMEAATWNDIQNRNEDVDHLEQLEAVDLLIRETNARFVSKLTNLNLRS
ncbi:hypothetical protein MMC28_010026 [Mycoblastus sanguinarius]|nr:hypothetical protein [Mycoblastus sanguinarius]